MRLLIGTDTYAPDVNGASYFTQHLAAGLADRGHDVHVLCPSTACRSAVVRSDDGVVVGRVNSKWPDRDGADSSHRRNTTT